MATAFNPRILSAFLLRGLNQQGDFFSQLPPALQALLADRRADRARCFLDALSLSCFSEQLSQLPAPDQFDPLPEVPEAGAHPPPSALVPTICALLREEAIPRAAVLAVLHNSRYALPDSILPMILNLESGEPLMRALIAQTLSPRGRWLVALNEDWTPYLLSLSAQSLDQLPPRCQSERLQAIFQADPKQALEFIQTQWKQGNGEARLRLLQWVRTLKGFPQARAWLESIRSDRSDRVRRAALRMLCAWHAEQGQAGRLALLSECLQKRGRLRHRLEIRLPEQDQPELGVLPLDESKLGFAKAVLRLGQLLVLVGPEALAQHLGLSLKKTYALLARSDFGVELCYFLLEAALVHESLAALEAWLLAYPDPPKTMTGARLAALFAQSHPQQIPNMLKTLGEPWLKAPEIWALIFQRGIECDAQLTADLMPSLCRALRSPKHPRSLQLAFLLIAQLHIPTALAEAQRRCPQHAEVGGPLKHWMELLELRKALDSPCAREPSIRKSP